MSEDGGRFCRGCGAPVAASDDLDENMGMGIAKVIAGDGFFMVSILLTVLESDVQSMLWLLLLIPAFFLFGLGFSDIFRARRARQRNEQLRRSSAGAVAELSPGMSAVGIEDKTTRELAAQSDARDSGRRPA